MGLREAVSEPIIEQEIIVETETDKYKIVGAPDINILARTILLTPDKVTMAAVHWGRVLGQPFEESIVKHVFVVHETLKSERWVKNEEFPEGTWVLESPYDITEVADFARGHSMDFLELMAAAYKAIGLAKDETPKTFNAFDQLAAGNSQEPQESS